MLFVCVVFYVWVYGRGEVILTARGASYHIKGKIYTACSECILLRTEAWAMKAEYLHSLEKAEHMMVSWMCGVLLKD